MNCELIINNKRGRVKVSTISGEQVISAKSLEDFAEYLFSSGQGNIENKLQEILNISEITSLPTKKTKSLEKLVNKWFKETDYNLSNISYYISSEIAVPKLVMNEDGITASLVLPGSFEDISEAILHEYLNYITKFGTVTEKKIILDNLKIDSTTQKKVLEFAYNIEQVSDIVQKQLIAKYNKEFKFGVDHKDLYYSNKIYYQFSNTPKYLFIGDLIKLSGQDFYYLILQKNNSEEYIIYNTATGVLESINPKLSKITVLQRLRINANTFKDGKKSPITEKFPEYNEKNYREITSYSELERTKTIVYDGELMHVQSMIQSDIDANDVHLLLITESGNYKILHNPPLELIKINKHSGRSLPKKINWAPVYTEIDANMSFDHYIQYLPKLEPGDKIKVNGVEKTITKNNIDGEQLICGQETFDYRSKDIQTIYTMQYEEFDALLFNLNDQKSTLNYSELKTPTDLAPKDMIEFIDENGNTIRGIVLNNYVFSQSNPKGIYVKEQFKTDTDTTIHTRYRYIQPGENVKYYTSNKSRLQQNRRINANKQLSNVQISDAFLDHLSSLFGNMPYEFVSIDNHKRAWTDGNTIYINLQYTTSIGESAVHELIHIVLGSLRFKNPLAYRRLLDLICQGSDWENFAMNNAQLQQADNYLDIMLMEEYVVGLWVDAVDTQDFTKVDWTTIMDQFNEVLKTAALNLKKTTRGHYDQLEISIFEYLRKYSSLIIEENMLTSQAIHAAKEGMSLLDAMDQYKIEC